jgi:glutamine cyclotransferase
LWSAPVVRFLLLILLFLPAGTIAAAGQEATPTPDVPCVVEPRTVDDMIELWFAPDGSPQVAAPVESQLVTWALDAEQGEPVDAPVAEAVEAVAHEWISCLNHGDLLRSYALMTDQHVTERGAVVDTPERARIALGGEPSRDPADDPMLVGPAVGARSFPDGRVGASFATTGIRRPDEALTLFVLFEQVDGQWRIDGMDDFAMPPPAAPVSGFRVLATYPHDPNAYTQGLVFIDGVMYEGTGLEGESELRRVDLDTGTVVQAHELAPDHFGEGIVVLGDHIYQITWQSGVAFVYDRETFAQLDAFVYQGEGWGLTTDGNRLIMSDGSDRLFIRDPETFEVLETVRVRDAGLPVSALNELEYIDGEVWANVYQTDWIVRIDPESGDVTGWVDMRGLRPQGDDARWENAGVLNGIAWDADGERLLVTGKDWPALYEIELTSAS